MWYPSPSEKHDKPAPDRTTSPEAAPSPAAATDEIAQSGAPADAKAAVAVSAPGTEYWLP